MNRKTQNQGVALYETPQMEVVEVMVEQGFAGSPVGDYPESPWQDEIEI